MERRTFLKSLAGGSIAGVAFLAGCKSSPCPGTEACSSAPCGKVCKACPAKAQGKCDGCRSPMADTKKAACPIRSCVAEKGFKTCAECSGFPCAKLKAWAEKSEANQAALKNLQSQCSK